MTDRTERLAALSLPDTGPSLSALLLEPPEFIQGSTSVQWTMQKGEGRISDAFSIVHSALSIATLGHFAGNSNDLPAYPLR